ncbi:MAG TPA: efflux RND transporter periplasmic adaptor subunit [Kofleriaceae bacterium]|nr:efflux RND transporter periplasmic adaptor subunit [Kofleriaceae bacterium]
MIVARTDPTAMDRVIVRPPRWRRRAVIAAAVIAIAGGAAFALHREGGRALAVEGSRVTFGRVTRGQFDDVIQIRGQVTPLRTTYVTTPSGGQVRAIAIEDGAHVEAGQPLLELANTQLQLDLISREAQITEQLNNLRSLELAQEQSRQVHEREMVEVHYQIKRLGRQKAIAARAVAEGVTPQVELDDLTDELDYYQRRLAVETETRATADKLQRAQLAQMRTAAEQLEANLDLARKNLDGLDVRAPAAGQLSAFTLEVGQTLAPGDRIAQIDDPDHVKVVASLDEFYLPRVDIGQHASWESYQLTVSKIRPQVSNGQFQIELVFDGDAPKDVRRGQTAPLSLRLGQPSEAVMVPNGAYYNDTGGTWVFVVSSDHRQAVRRNVKLGRRNPQQIEVLDGLSVDEEIVTSPYTNFLDRDRLELGH